MAAPNLLALATLYNKTAILDATSTETDLIGAVATNAVVNIDSVLVGNVNTSGVVGEITIIHKRSGTDHTICYKKRVPTKETINIFLGKNFVLEEGDSLRAIGGPSSSGNVSCFAPYSLAST